jgi:non-ribosomal peptide synthetase component E (peptide arylation enzyme)
VDLARNLTGRINVGDSLTRTAASRPDRLAVVDGERRFSYAEFNGYVNRLAHGLAGLGYERGAALALASGNSADFLAVYYACAKLGVVCVPIILVGELPKTSTGKIQKNVMRSEHSKYYEEG